MRQAAPSGGAPHSTFSRGVVTVRTRHAVESSSLPTHISSSTTTADAAEVALCAWISAAMMVMNRARCSPEACTCTAWGGGAQQPHSGARPPPAADAHSTSLAQAQAQRDVGAGPHHG